MKLLLPSRGRGHRLVLRAPGVAAGIWRLIGHALLTLWFLAPPLAGAAQDERYVSRAEHDKLKQELEVLKAQLHGLLDPKAKQPATVPQVAAKPAQAEQPRGAVSVGDREKEAEKAKRDLDEFLRRQKVLFKPGEIELEFGASYSHDTFGGVCARQTQSVACAEGVVTRSAGTNITARYGLAEDVELNVSVPFTYFEQEEDVVRNVHVPRPPGTDHAGLSDISAALRYAVWHEDGGRPEVVLSLSGKSTTGDQDRRLGTGHWNVGGAVTLIKTIDPVVLFGSLGYTATLERAGIDPGDQIPYSFGMGFSLNDRVSVSAALAGTVVRRAAVNGNELVGSARDFHTLQLSTTVQVGKYLFVEPFVGFGLTQESPDFIAGINIPYRLPVVLRLPFHN